MSGLLRVFVYGTLKPGELNFDRYCRTAFSAEPAWVQGQIYALSLGYPAVVLGGSALVTGVLLCFEDGTVLDRLDELEDYRADRPDNQNEYQRQWCRIFYGDPQEPKSIGAWVYEMEADRVLKLAGVALDGIWTHDIQLQISQKQGWLRF